MDVCMLTITHSPLDDRIFFKEARTLQKNGYNVSIIAPWEKDDRIENIDIVGIKLIGPRVIRRILLVLQLFLKAICRKSRVYHCHEPDSLIIAILIKLLRFNRALVIYDVHEHYPEQISEIPLFPKFSKASIRSIIEIIEKFCVYFTDYIITVDYVLEEKFKTRNTTVISNFPDTDIFRPVNNVEVKSLIDGYGENIIIYAGGLAKSRGTIEIIKSIRLVRDTFPDILMLFLGSFSDKKFKNETMQLVKTMNLENNVKFLGQIPHEEVYKYIHISEIGLITESPIPRYIRCQYPIKLFEYMACSKPVISSDFPEMGRIIKDDDCGLLVDPTSPEEISRAIIYLLKNPESAKKMGENGLRAVKEKYNWGLMEERLLFLYSKI